MAIASDLDIDLSDGGITTVGGVQMFSLETGTVIENAVGGDGNDEINGNSLSNALYGMRGDDQIFGGLGDDILGGGAGNDLLDGGDGNDTVYYTNALSGVTVSLAIAGAQSTGGAGTDILDSMEWLAGSGFADTLTGDANDNLLQGNGGDDILIGGGGNNQFYGDAGDDFMASGDGTDLFVGGAGSDTVSYESAGSRVQVDLGISGSQNTLGGGFDTFDGVENLIGTSQNDVVIGSIFWQFALGPGRKRFNLRAGWRRRAQWRRG